VKQLDGINFTMYDNNRAQYQSKFEKMDIISQTEETFTNLYMDLSRYLFRYFIHVSYTMCVIVALCKVV